MRDAEIAAWLVGYIRTESFPRDTGRPEIVHCDGKAGVPQGCCCEGGDGCAEGVAYDGDCVVRVEAGGVADGGDDAVAGVEPALPEAGVGGAVGTQVGGGGFEIEVGDPGVYGGAAAEGDDDEVVGVVEGDVAGYVGGCFCSVNF